MSGEQRPIDEIPNLITHGLGLLLSLVATALLMDVVLAGGDRRTIIGCGIYSLTLVLLYGASTLSHTFYNPDLRRLFRMLDQACIFLLIAGSVTPFAMIFLADGPWRLLLPTMWTLAALGVLFVLRRRNLSNPAKITYGVLGWLPILVLPELARRAPAELLMWVVGGGAFYSLGTVFLALDQKIRYFHALWHTFVVAGSICHYVAILAYIAPYAF